LCEKDGLNDNVVFWGYMAEDNKFSELMANNTLGIALYKDEENFMKYTEPAKVKYYLNYGIPAIVSKVPKIADELDCQKVAFAVENHKDEIVKVVIEYVENLDKQKEYKENIKRFMQTVEVSYLLNDRLEKTLSKL
jgi:hypothetical protein